MDTISTPSLTAPPLSFDERLAALTKTIDAHHVYLQRYLEGLTHNHADAEDLLSELWIFVLRKFKDQHIECLPILRRKAYQLFVDYYRSKSGENLEFCESPPEPIVQHVGKEAYTLEEEATLKIRFWSEYPVDMPELYKEIIWLSLRYGFTIQEISGMLKVPPSTVGDWLPKARQLFIDYFNTL